MRGQLGRQDHEQSGLDVTACDSVLGYLLSWACDSVLGYLLSWACDSVLGYLLSWACCSSVTSWAGLFIIYELDGVVLFD